jgi:hypothetical protein
MSVNGFWTPANHEVFSYIYMRKYTTDGGKLALKIHTGKGQSRYKNYQPQYRDGNKTSYYTTEAGRNRKIAQVYDEFGVIPEERILLRPPAVPAVG